MAPKNSLLRIARPLEVYTRLDISRSTLHRWVKAGKFPPPRRLGPNSVGWLLEDLNDWLGDEW